MSAPIVVIAVAGAAPLLFKSSTSIALLIVVPVGLIVVPVGLIVVPVGMWAKGEFCPRVGKSPRLVR